MKICASLAIFVTLSFLLTGCGNQTNTQNNEEARNNAEFARTNIEKDVTDTQDNNQNDTAKNEKSSNNDTAEKANSSNEENKQPAEKEVSNFSTPLKSGSPNRLTNIKLTCDKINGRVLENGETFSFNEIVGPCTAEEGYKKAEIYVNKRIKYALGGGNCQVSTTLYNAVLAVQGLEVTERHEHNGRSVDYIEDGKDATVSYNTLDLKFVNNTGKAVKLYTSIDDSNVYARITEIE